MPWTTHKEICKIIFKVYRPDDQPFLNDVFDGESICFDSDTLEIFDDGDSSTDDYLENIDNPQTNNLNTNLAQLKVKKLFVQLSFDYFQHSLLKWEIENVGFNSLFTDKYVKCFDLAEIWPIFKDRVFKFDSVSISLSLNIHPKIFYVLLSEETYTPTGMGEDDYETNIEFLGEFNL